MKLSKMLLIRNLVFQRNSVGCVLAKAYLTKSISFVTGSKLHLLSIRFCSSMSQNLNEDKKYCKVIPEDLENNVMKNLQYKLDESFVLENLNKSDLTLVSERFGLKWKRYFVLNDLLKGHRKGELTIFSGQTETGKTTFMSEYSLDLCTQGLPTLWASFKISNTKLMATMLNQYSKCSLVENSDAREHWANEFTKIPMFFLQCDNSNTLEGILKMMANAILLYNVQHIVIDNLQFMMNMDDYNSTIDQFQRQDQIFSAFRTFATNKNCHITLVIHPKKEPEFTALNTNSISGTAKATQEADNVLILQTTKSGQYLQITKNRFNGQKGCVAIEFDRKTQTYAMKKISSNQKSEKESSILC